MMFRVGLDLSINSTGVVVIKNNKTIDYHIITPKLTKKQEGCQYINYHTYEKSIPQKDDKYSTKESIKTQNIRYIVDEIENILFNKWKIHKATNTICVEGVAFGASGDVIGLAGLNYAVRYMLISHGQEFKIISPTDNKKQAVGNGGADKDVMVDAFMRCTGFKNPLGVKIDDIADAYFLAMYDE